MKTILIALFIFAVSLPKSMAEGIASMTDVTSTNGKTLDHHSLEVHCRTQHGRTTVDLQIRPDEKSPLSTCDVVIYAEDGKRELVRFTPAIGNALTEGGASRGSRVLFYVSEKMIDQIEIRYHLRANENQTHLFAIKAGELRGLSKLGFP